MKSLMQMFLMVVVVVVYKIDHFREVTKMIKYSIVAKEVGYGSK